MKWRVWKLRGAGWWVVADPAGLPRAFDTWHQAMAYALGEDSRIYVIEEDS